MMRFVGILLSVSIAMVGCLRRDVKQVDICIYGGTSAGVIAAYTAARSGKTVLLVEPGQRLGGMSSGGLGFTDIGNKYVVQGLALDFYRRIGQHYGKLEQWIFTPGVAKSCFDDYVSEADVEVWFDSRIVKASKRGSVVTTIELESSEKPSRATNRKVHAKMFIDCSYEGDLMARSGVEYFVGREANALYGETYNGVQMMDRHQVPEGIDPYIIQGDPSSGVVWGVNTDPVQPDGTGDGKVQAYNFRICLTDDPDNMIPIGKPDNYDPARYELARRIKAKYPWKHHTDLFIWTTMPDRKTDINNMGGFSTDMIGMNWSYPEADYREREQIWKQHEDYTRGLLWFVGNDPSVPEHIRAEMRRWGYPRDEYTENDHWTPQLYVREARRMVGDLVMTQHHCEGREIVSDPVGWAAYTMDSHNCDRHVTGGMVRNEGNVEIGGFGPYPISYRAITPKRGEADNLLVPVCLSASHIAYGSIRMEPVFMVLGQSAAIAAVMAIDGAVAVQDVDAAKVLAKLHTDPLADGSLPEIVVDNDDPYRVEMAGSWEKQQWMGYGADFVTSIGNDAGSSVRYTPQIATTAQYDLYTYVPKIDDATHSTFVKVFDGSKEHSIVLRSGDIVVTGQTSGEWIGLGRYGFREGTSGYVEISGRGEGAVVADAVLLVPVK